MSLDSNDSHHVIEQWQNIQENVKVIILVISPLKDSKYREILSTKNWNVIVQFSHVDFCGKHLTFCTVLPKIRKNSSIDTRVGGISSTYVEQYLQSCKCTNVQL